MSYSNFLFEVRDHVATITLNRPGAFNAIDLSTAREFCDIANRCSLDPKVRAVLLTGAGEKAFCAGGDVASFACEPDGVGLLLAEVTSFLHQGISRLARGPAPVLAAVNGVAAGAGLSLMAGCDLAIASDNARFVSSYTRVGLSPDGSASYYLPRLLGVRRATEMILTNRVLNAQEALDWGLVNRVVPPAQLREDARAWALELAQGPAVAQANVKKLLQMSDHDTLESQMELETRMIIESATSQDGREGVRAFVEKRAPNFGGR